MQVNLIEVKVKNKKNKIFFLIILVLLIIALFSMLGIYAAKMYNKEYIQKQKNRNNIASNVELQKDTQVNIKKQQNKKNQIPKYSQTAKDNMRNIYNSEKKIAYLTFDDGPF